MAELSPILADMSSSDGDPRDLTNQQLTQLREYFNSSLFHFAWTFFGFKDLEASGYRPVHREVCQLLALWGNEPTEPWHPGRRLMIQVPRGSYKTSLCTLANSLWQVSRNPDETILICNEVVDNSKKWLRAIRETIMSNRLYQAVYRDLLPPGIHWGDRERGRSIPRWWKWSDQEVVLQRPTLGIPEATLTAAGVGTATTGGHWTRLIKDDLVSEDAKNSPSVMQKVRDWFDSSLPLEKPPYKGVDLVVCTPWTYDDVYRYILEKYDYKLYRRSVLEEHPTSGETYSLLPHKWTVEELHRERDRDPYYFSSQMMCQPKAGKSQSFDPDWLREFFLTQDAEPHIVVPTEHYSKTISLTSAGGDPPQRFPLSWCSKVLLVDPASADQAARERKDHARTGLVVEAIDPWGRRFILDAWAGKGSPADAINRIFAVAQRWQLSKVGIEEVTFSIVYSYWLRQEIARRNYQLSVIPLKPRGRNKQDRIEQLIPGFRNGFYYLNQGSEGMRALRREYLDYPYGANRDLLDALAYDSDIAFKPEVPVFLDEDARDERATQRDVTGYGEPYF